RIIVRATPNERLEILLSGDYTHQDSSLTLGSNQAPICQNALFLPAAQINKACQPPQGFFGNKVIAPAAGPWQRTSATDFKNGEGQEMTSWGVSGTISAELNDMFTLVSITAYRELKPQYYIDIDATTTQTGNVKVFVDQNQFSQELQLKLASDSFDGVFGLYYLNENLQSDQVAYANDVFSLFGTVPVTFQRTVHDAQDLKSYAAYGQLTWKATDTFSVTGGLRYTDETKQYFRTTTTTSSLGALNGTFTFPDSLYGNPAVAGLDLTDIDNQSWSDWTPMITASWKVRPGQMLYATASKGFNSGGYNGRANCAADLIQFVDGVKTLAVTFEPESAWNFEAGYKANWAEGKVTLAVSGFYTNYENFQARVGDTDATTGIGYLPVINAGAMRIYGFEMESTVRLIPNLVLTGSLGYLNAQYTEFDDTRANGCNPTGTKIVCEPAFAPPITARLAADYTIPVGVDGSVGLG
ncbi:MAG: TonB-dependent receptor, partial [Polymorphobacter sp.]